MCEFYQNPNIVVPIYFITISGIIFINLIPTHYGFWDFIRDNSVHSAYLNGKEDGYKEAKKELEAKKEFDLYKEAYLKGKECGYKEEN